MTDILAALSDDSLGWLDLGCFPYVVVSLQIGSPQVRAVIRNRALADGAHDDTRFLGPRAVTVNLRLNNTGRYQSVCADPTKAADMQQLLDRVVPYMSPRLRPILSYRLPGSSSARSMVVRGDSWPFAVAGPKYPTLPLQFICPSGEIFSGTPQDPDQGLQCITINPSISNESGRHYGLPDGFADDAYGPMYTNDTGNVDRAYPASLPVGGRLVTLDGSAPAHWIARIHGEVTDPMLSVNGVEIQFSGLTLPQSQWVTIDTRSRTILLDDDPASSRYALTNFNEWSWDQLPMRPGENVVVFNGEEMNVTANVDLCWRPTWLA